MTTQELIRRPVLFAISVWGLWLKERFCNPIGYPRSEQYQWHGQWQVDLLKRRVLRLWQRAETFKCIKEQRFALVLLTALGAIFLLSWYVTGKWCVLPTVSQIDFVFRDSPTSWTAVLALASSPIALMIWWFRDINNREAIENQRKDTNLKDFHQLSQWASGLHLVETQKTETQERNANKDGLSEKTLITTQSSQPLAGNWGESLQPPSRVEGAAGLQIAAVYQLQSFLRGDYGKHFQRPAFSLLKTVWLTLVQESLTGRKKTFFSAFEDMHATFKIHAPDSAKDMALGTILQFPLATAVNDALTREHGLALQQHKKDLPNANLAGMRAWDLELDAADLNGIQWQTARLFSAQLQGANLQWTQLQNTTLGGAKLQIADLKWAQLDHTALFDAQLQGADLSHAKLPHTHLGSAQLQGALLENTQLQSAFFHNAQLQGAIFRNVNLQLSWFKNVRLEGTKLYNPVFDQGTTFHGSQTDSQTLVSFISLDGSGLTIPISTHAMRLKLRNENGLQLHELAYTEYLAEWENADVATQDQTYAIAGTEAAYKP